MKKATTQKLMKVYEALPPTEKAIMHRKALFYELARKTDFLTIMQQSSLTGLHGKRMTQKSLGAIIERLKDRKLLDKQYNCQKSLLHPISMQALSPKNPQAQTLLNDLKRSQYYQDSFPPDLSLYNELNQSLPIKYFRTVHVAIHANLPTIFQDTQRSDAFWVDILEIVDLLFAEEKIDWDWFKTRAPIIQSLLCLSKLSTYYASYHALPCDFDVWVQFYCQHRLPELHAYLCHVAWKIDLHLGRLPELTRTLSAQKNITPSIQWTQGAVDFLSGDHQSAVKHYESGLKIVRKLLKKRNWFMSDIHGLLYLLGLIAVEADQTKAIQAVRYVLKHSPHADKPAFSLMEALAEFELGHQAAALSTVEGVARIHEKTEFTQALLAILAVWMDLPQYQFSKQKLMQKFQKHLKHFPLIAYLYAGLLPKAEAPPVLAKFLATTPFKACQWHQLIRVKPKWEYQLHQLSQLMGIQSNATGHPTAGEERLIWLVNPKKPVAVPMVQKRGKTGKWSKGRSIALSRLYESDKNLTFMTEQDHAAAKGLQQEHEWSRYGSRPVFSWQTEKIFPALIGHPLVFLQENTNVPIELIAGEIELHIDQVKAGYHLSLSTNATRPCVILQQARPHCYSVLVFTEKEVSMSKLLTNKGLTVPEQAKDQLLTLLQRSEANIKISSDLAVDSLPSVAGDPTCCLQLLPVEEGLKISVWVRPFGQEGPYYQPGQGRRHVIAQTDSPDGPQRQKAERDLDQEMHHAQLVHDTCFPHVVIEEGVGYIESPMHCLEMLSALADYQQTHPVQIEWPKGQAYRIKKKLTHQDIQFSVSSEQQWFEYDGQVALDEDKTMQMKALMALLDKTHHHGRFVQIAPGEFIELTQRLKQQLEELHQVSESGKVYHLGASALQALVDETEDVQYDKSWEAHVERLQAMRRYQPTLPSTLQATLRDYQLEGFQYLSRLAHWQIGACLADDMGLGKTVQSIAVLLEHGKQGPSLVIAPTSVCFNWCEELNKFAPALTVRTLQQKNREAVIAGLQPMEVLICSYGLMVQLADALIEQSWHTIILDEAQSIKNASTKRWKTAVQLRGQCRIALTGTPIENHLGELWSLFRFLNPGLLSTQQNFQKNYVNPIERQQDTLAKQSLKNVIQPYILRRIKSEVLSELPPKTEQTIMVERSPSEVAFYEAVRRRALEAIQETVSLEGGQKRIAILAEITKLRQACCSAMLLQPDVQVENSKIKTLLSLLDTLKENHHKALIFSQFVRYLSIIKTHVDAQKLTYQYIDGRTPAAQRKKAVTAFQGGEGDLFLLSLKAGGTGLNLTAADYVIHLDPWWNPAVEDQASDRAHRIGQERPVTIYRLIMKDTIEEKILAMHKDKRTLATDLLSGGEVSGKLSEEELIQLIS